MEIIPLKKADAATIYSTLVDQKHIQCSKLVGIGAATRGKKWCSDTIEEEFASRFVCALSLPSTSTCMCTSSKSYSWN